MKRLPRRWLKMNSLTFYFDEIIPDYETWQSYVSTRNFVNYKDATESAFDKWVYTIFSAQYDKHNIRYDNPESFILKVLNIYENKFKQFLTEVNTLKDIYGLTAEDFALVNNSIASRANNPNFSQASPTTWLGYISNQTIMQQTENKLRAYLTALKNMPSMQIDKFLRRQEGEAIGFNDLFINIFGKIKNIYGG